MTAPRPIVFIALGSNVGDSAGNILRAMECLQPFSAAPLLKSSLWQTAPVDCPPGSPMFVNAVVGLAPRAGETPESLLAKMKRLETELMPLADRLHRKILAPLSPEEIDILTQLLCKLRY